MWQAARGERQDVLLLSSSFSFSLTQPQTGRQTLFESCQSTELRSTSHTFACERTRFGGTTEIPQSLGIIINRNRGGAGGRGQGKGCGLCCTGEYHLFGLRVFNNEYHFIILTFRRFPDSYVDIVEDAMYPLFGRGSSSNNVDSNQANR